MQRNKKYQYIGIDFLLIFYNRVSENKKRKYYMACRGGIALKRQLKTDPNETHKKTSGVLNFETTMQLAFLHGETLLRACL